MNDYKQLIEHVRNMAGYVKDSLYEMSVEEALLSAAEAIETLLAERDAAIESMHGRCDDCISMDRNPEERLCDKCCYCLGEKDCWQWRGIGGSDGT